jgi:hypothetical protein
MQPCSKRKTIVIFNQDGTKDDTFQCSERTAQMHTLTVLESDCEKCPVRKIVNSRSIDHEARRTSNLRGFIREDKDQGSLGFPACDARYIATVQSCCGETGSVWVCKHRASSRFQSEVTSNICNQCPLAQ